MPNDEADAQDMSRNWLAAEDALGRPPHPVIGYLASLGFVVAATVIGVAVRYLLPASDLALIFVLPVLLAATAFGWGPALVAALAAVAAFDFFFVQPLYTLRVGSPADLWTMGLLLVVAAVVSTLAAQSRRRALDARAAADRADALHNLAHLVITGAPAPALWEAATEALARTFQAPAVMLVGRGDNLETAARAQGAVLSKIDKDAALWTLANTTPTRAGTFPFDGARFDFWPLALPGGQRAIVGVGATAEPDERPADPLRQVELIGAYLKAGLAHADGVD